MGNHKWTEKSIREKAKNFNRKVDFKKAHRQGYIIACKLNIINDLGFIECRKEWTKESIKKEVEGCKTFKDFILKNKSAYHAAKRIGILYDFGLENAGNRFNRCIYAIEFEDNHVYIGLTYNFKERINNHFNMTRIDSSAQKHFIKTKSKYDCKKLTKYINVSTAQKLEKEFVDKYKNDKWIILNKVKTGAIGGSLRKWTKESALMTIKKYENYTDIANSNDYGAYKFIVKHHFLNEIEYNKK